MSELEADNTFVFGEECLAYKKSEADKVIAELKEKNKRLEEFKDKYRSCAKKAIDGIAKCELQLHHQKYKRCLAMAKLAIKNDYLPWNMKWHRRWLELAEKFRPNNSTAQ